MSCKKTPFTIKRKKVQKSPFGSVNKTRKALRNSKLGKSIGFTATSSLKSMGLIPRSNGCYVLGAKYL
jgi:hypothetical protein